MDLNQMLCRVAERVVEHGTREEAGVLCAVSSAAADLVPGAAAALVAWEDSEIARLRAFGVVHGAILRSLGAEQRTCLMQRLGRADQLSPRVR